VSAHLGPRDILQIPIHCTSSSQFNAVKETVPAPFYRDPMKEPLPAPEFQEVVQRFTGKMFESKLLKEFEIYTPKEDKYSEYKKPEKKLEKTDKRGTFKKTTKQETEPEVVPEKLDVKIESLSK